MDTNPQRGPYRVYFAAQGTEGSLGCTLAADGTIFCGCGTADRWYLEGGQYVDIGTAYQPARQYVGLTLEARVVA